MTDASEPDPDPWHAPRPDAAAALRDLKRISLPLGVVLRRAPGVTRWARFSWKPVAVLPGAPPADWKLLREDGEAADFHIGTLDLTLWRGEAEAYRIALSEPVVPVFVVLRPTDRPDRPYRLHLVTASPHEAALYSESGEEIVEKVPMPDALAAWVAAWVDAHYVEEPFVKRKRKRHDADRDPADGIGDPRIAKPTDVYSTPARRRQARRS